MQKSPKIKTGTDSSDTPPRTFMRFLLEYKLNGSICCRKTGTWSDK